MMIKAALDEAGVDARKLDAHPGAGRRVPFCMDRHASVDRAKV